MSLSDCAKCWDTPCRCPDGEIGQLKARIALLEHIRELQARNEQMEARMETLKCGCRYGACESKIGFICNLDEEIAAQRAGIYERNSR